MKKLESVEAIWSLYDQKVKLTTNWKTDLFSYKACLMLTAANLAWKKYRPEDKTVLYLDIGLENWAKFAERNGYLMFDEYRFIDFAEIARKCDTYSGHWSWPKIATTIQQDVPFVVIDWDVFLEARVEVGTSIITYPPYSTLGTLENGVDKALAQKWGLWEGVNNSLRGINGGFIYYPNVEIAKFINTCILQFFSRKTGEFWGTTRVMEEVFINEVIELFHLPRTTVSWSTELNSGLGPCHWAGKNQENLYAIRDLQKYLTGTLNMEPIWKNQKIV